MLTDLADDVGPRSRNLRPAARDIRPAAPLSAVLVSDEEPEAEGRFQTELAEIWRRLNKHRWLILAAIVASLAVGAVLTLLTRPSYTAQSTLQIDRESAKVVNVEDVTPREEMVSGEEFFRTQYGLLRSESLAQRVAENLGLARGDDFARKMNVKPLSGSASDRMDQVVSVLEKHLGVVPNRGSRLVAITYSSPDPGLSAQIANAFAENFIGSNLDRRFESSSYARDFLEKRLAQTKAKLEEQERQLTAYATAQGIINLNEGAGSGSGPNAAPAPERSLASADLESLSAALSTAKADRIRAQQRWAAAQGSSGADTADVLQNPTIEQLTQAKAAKVAEYQDKLAVYRPEYPDMKQLKAQIDELSHQIATETSRIRTSVREQYVVAANSERSLNSQVEGLKSAVLDLRNRSIQYNILQREVDTSRILYEGLLQRYKEVGVAGGVTTNNISIVDRAKPPRSPSEPKPIRNMVVAGLIGAFLGLVLAFLREALDEAVRLPADVESKLRLPVLGSIPIVARNLQPKAALADPRSNIAEAYFSLRSALQFSTKNGFPKSLLLTSTRPGEGKSTTAYALAQGMARLGLRTLLVDADLRNPSMHKMLAADNRSGLSVILTGAAVSYESVVQTTEAANLFLIPSGPLPPIPTELLSGARLTDFIASASRDFDMVIVDGPPVMGLADAPLIGSAVSATIVLVEAGRTGRAQARAAVRRLQGANAHVLGVVLTKFNAKSASYGYGYAYEYEYEYGRRTEATPAHAALSKLRSEARKLIARG